MKPVVVAISGSLRSGSFNTIILETLVEELADLADIRLHTIADIPLYNEDNDGKNSPDTVVRLRDAVRGAAGVILATPEYNHGMSGVLKNALDWLSRPHFGAALVGKPVVNITSSVAFIGGVRAHAQLHETLLAIPAKIVLRPPAVIPSVHEKIAEGRFVDELALEFIRQSVKEMLEMREAA